MTAVLASGPSEARAPGRDRSSAPGLAFAARGADLGVGDLVGKQGVDLGRLGGGVTQTAADDLDGHAAVDQLGGVRVAELVDADPGADGGTVLFPPVVRRVVGQRPTAAVDGRAESMCERATPARDPAPASGRPRSRGRVRPTDADALAELEFHWESAYHLAVIDGFWTARRRDGKGTTLTEPTPEGLRLQILADYAAVRVPRDLP
jgi:hypothetical protein